MGPQVQPKCFRHPQHMRNNWELRKWGYLIRFGHTEALLVKKKKDIKRPFFPPCTNWPIYEIWHWQYESMWLQSFWNDSILKECKAKLTIKRLMQLTYNTQHKMFNLIARSCAALWSTDLGSSGQDTFRAGTFGDFPMFCFAPPELNSNWIITLY